MEVGTWARICVLEVESSGIEMSPNVTQEPPRTVGGGMVSAVAAVARFLPVMVMKEPGRMLVVVPSEELMMPRVALIEGIVLTPEGVSGTTLKPERVMM